MQFVVLRKADAETEAGTLPGKQVIDDMTSYNAGLVARGAMKSGAGLTPSSRGARVSFSNGKPKVIDGPFAEAKELIAGYTLIQARSREEAIEWVKRWPPLDGDGEVELEIRQLYELEDFGPSEAIDRMRDLGEQLAARK